MNNLFNITATTASFTYDTFLSVYLPQILAIGWNIVLAIVILLVGRKIIKIATKSMSKLMIKFDTDKGLTKFATSSISWGLYAILIFILADIVGIPTAQFIAVLGSAGVAIGLALQGSLSNLAGGVLLLTIKPFKVGDYISESTDNVTGTVTAVDLFYTTLITPDNQMVFIPNGKLSAATVTNVTYEPTRRVDLSLSVSYSTDIKAVREIIIEAINSREKVITPENTVCFVDNLADSGVVLGVRFFTSGEFVYTEKWEALEQIKELLDKNNIEIPFPQLEVRMK